MTRRSGIILAVSAALLLGGIAWWRLRPSSNAAAPEADEEVVVSVHVAPAERREIASEVSAAGTVFPRAQATVSAAVGARIRQMRLLQNVWVRAGDVIARLDDRDLRAQRAEAVAALEEARLSARGVGKGAIPLAGAQAERDLRDARAGVENAHALYERRRGLYALGGIALKELEAAQLALAQAENSLRLAERTAALRRTVIDPNDRAVAASRVRQSRQRVATLDAQLRLTTIRAPISGNVTEQFQFAGEYVAAGGRLVTIADIDKLIVKARFADTVAARIREGDPAMVLPDDTHGVSLSGRVSLVSRTADPQSRAVEVWVSLPGVDPQRTRFRLRPGGSADVVVTDRRVNKAIVVPASAVTLDAANADAGTVMVVDAENVAHEKKVRVGIRAGNQVQIVSGLRAGERVVTEGNYALPDGAKVEAGDENETEEKTP